MDAAKVHVMSTIRNTPNFQGVGGMDSETEIVEFKSRLSPQRVEGLLAKAASHDGSIGLQGRGDVAAQLKCALGALAARTDFFSVLRTPTTLHAPLTKMRLTA